MNDDIKNIHQVVQSPARTGMTRISKVFLESRGVPLYFKPIARSGRPAHQYVCAAASEGMSACRIDAGNYLVVGKSRVGKTAAHPMTILNMPFDE